MIQLRTSPRSERADRPVNASAITLVVRGKVLTSRIEVAHCRDVKLAIHVSLAIVQLDGDLDGIAIEHHVDDIASAAQIVYARSPRHRTANIHLAARSPDLPAPVELQMIDDDGQPASAVAEALSRAPVLPPAGVAQCAVRLAQGPPDGDWAWTASALQRDGGWPDLAS